MFPKPTPTEQLLARIILCVFLAGLGTLVQWAAGWLGLLLAVSGAVALFALKWAIIVWIFSE